MKNSIRRFIGITSILAMAMSLVALPAAAATPSVSATLAAADTVLEAGETHDFTVTFRNDEPAGTLGTVGRGATVDVLQIASPTFIFDPATFVVPETIGSFRTFVDDGTITLFDGTLAPQATLTVPFTARIKDHFSSDRGSTFFAQASQTDDTSLGGVSGDLSFIVDILKLDTIALTQPASVAGFESLGIVTGVTDNSVTANQSGVTIEVGVTNNGGVEKNITATLTGVSGSGSALVPAHSSGTITIPNVTFGSSNTTIDARLTATGAEREPQDDPAQVAVTVQGAPNLVRSNVISPDYVGLGSHTVSLPLNKTGVPAIVFDGTVTLTSQKDESAGPGFTVTDRVVPRNNQSFSLSGTLDFGQLVDGVPQFTAGWYDVSLLVSDGIDDNGKPLVDQTIDMGDIFFDPLAPIFERLTFAGQAPFVGPRDAVTHGEGFSYSLRLLNDGVDREPCAQCPVTLTVVDASNSLTGYATLEVTTNDNGEASGTITNTWPDLSHIDVSLLGSGLDRGTNQTEPVESFATVSATDPTVKVSLIDTLPPAVDPAAPASYAVGDVLFGGRISAYTGGFADYEAEENRRRVLDVVFDEPVDDVAGPVGVSPLDWDVDNHTVIEATPREFVRDAKTYWGVRLRLNEDLGRNERPGVAYERAATSAQLRDRVEQDLVNGAVQTIIDNILPELPSLDVVDGQQAYVDEEFHTNLAHYTAPRDDTPVANTELVLNLSQVEGGATVVVRKRDGDTTVTLAEEENTSTEEFITQEIRIPLSDLGAVVPAFGATDVLTLEIFATDSSANSSPIGTHTINLDRDAPGEAGVTNVAPATNEVTIAADEPLRQGRNDPIDWKVKINSDGDAFNVGVETVSPGADDTERVLKVSNQWQIATGTEVELARFAYVGDADARLVDPAGNRLPLFGNFLNPEHSTTTGP